MIVHLNSRLLPLDEARVSPLDRGFLFGDGIYEGLRAFNSHIVGLDRHITRLRAGLDEARIPFNAATIGPLCRDLLRANNLADAFIYLQVTRGVPLPGHPVRTRVPVAPLTPTVFAYATPTAALDAYAAVPAKSALTTRDTRWLRGRVKSISLIGSVLAGYEAHEAGADDAILIREREDGSRWAAESTSANLLAVIDTPAGRVIATPPLDQVPILAGVTRDILIDASLGTDTPILQCPISAGELSSAREVMLCGTLTMVTAVTQLDGRAVGDSRPGPVARRLLDILCDRIRANA
ncbi:D-alanine transaminase [Phycisphaerales bacterium]|nr:D-alanine transaminase [Phycisphaerales bacterium]